MPETMKPQILIRGLIFVESARWHQGRFWFSDWGTQQIFAVDSDGENEVMVGLSSGSDEEEDAVPGPLCFDFLPDGRLLIVAGRDATASGPGERW